MTHPLAPDLRRHAGSTRPLIVGIAGSVAVGKSTFAAELAREQPNAVTSATDGFLFPNTVLAERNLALRKGFPESYDVEAMRAALTQVKAGARTALPQYSHVTYDVDAANPIVVENPPILILDGLHLAQIEREGRPRLIDLLIYLDADEAVIETWFTARLIPLMIAARSDPTSFYHRFRDWNDEACNAFAAQVWSNINLPNLRDHIVKDREAAHIVVTKAADHSIQSIERRAG